MHCVSLSRSLAFSLARSRSRSRSRSLSLSLSLSFFLSDICTCVYKVLACVIIITKSQDLLSGHNTDENAFYVHVINSNFKEHRENTFLRMQVLGTGHKFSFTKPTPTPLPPTITTPAKFSKILCPENIVRNIVFNQSLIVSYVNASCHVQVIYSFEKLGNCQWERAMCL